jgi:hypothetical protein
MVIPVLQISFNPVPSRRPLMLLPAADPTVHLVDELGNEGNERLDAVDGP